MQTVSITRTSSSRATIAAGTSPPRVIATIASNGPRRGEAPGERARVAVELVPGNRKGLVAGGGHTSAPWAVQDRFSIARATGRASSRRADQHLSLGRRSPRLSALPPRRKLGEHRLDRRLRRRDGARILAAHDDLVVEAPVPEGRVGADRHVRRGRRRSRRARRRSGPRERRPPRSSRPASRRRSSSSSRRSRASPA